jgi:hypothetical protein
VIGYVLKGECKIGKSMVAEKSAVGEMIEERILKLEKIEDFPTYRKQAMETMLALLELIMLFRPKT